jgi:predicted phage terminase large subunit-like protein
MGKWPNSRIILASYASTIAYKQSRKARAICRQSGYSSIWSEAPKLLDDQRAVDDWSLTSGAQMMAAGLLAGITGNRATGAVIDDPVANREKADSPIDREKIYAEYVDTVLTRMLPHGWIILIMTRWHEDDLAGGILPADYAGESGLVKCRDGQTWKILCLPAECERADDPLGRQPGDFIWPEWFPREHWSKWRDNPRAQRTWSALFQQRPAPLTGVHFNREMARWYDPDVLPDSTENARPQHLNLYGATDYATLDADGDFTEHGVAGMDSKGNLYLLDWWFGQKETDVSIAQFIRLLRFWRLGGYRVRKWTDEGGPIGKAIGPAIRRAMREANEYVHYESLSSIMDKTLKLQSFHARMSAGTVYFPLKRPWATRLLDLLVSFPAGKHDDGPDVCGLLGRMIDTMQDALIPVAPERDLLVPFSAKWVEWGSGNEPKRVRYTS